MKKQLLLIGFVLLGLHIHAQQGSIFYTEYDCDTVIPLGSEERIEFDVDLDDEWDFHMDNYMGGPDDFVTGFYFVARSHPPYQRYFAFPQPFPQPTGENGIIHTGDTLCSYPTWTSYISFVYEWDCIDPQVNGFRGYLGTRKQIDGHYYYGWIEFKMFWDTSLSIYVPTPRLVLYGTAFCTIPDYPLRAGQTSLDWDIGTYSTTAYAYVQPNPTNGKVTVKGNNLSQAEVYNVLGQRIATVKATGGGIGTVDLSAQPAGIYLVSITDKEGKRCVKKVMKQ